MLTRMAPLLTHMARMLTRMTRWLAYYTHSDPDPGPYRSLLSFIVMPYTKSLKIFLPSVFESQ